MVVCIATIKAKPEYADKVKSELLKMIEPTRAEKGCIQYDMLIDDSDENTFVFYEVWEEGRLEAHQDSAHFQACFAEIKDLLDHAEGRVYAKAM